ncbi:hypothetical protein E2C01_068640 [Portunus trituberculatus]|uniref:Uncharacterized protein n=1 Tax=Portunus trituberculatus TaxID=210409 RepID=A0A5B7HWG1_PORTR|nr:hypothetical protein [Portunus trituberculatus]
MCPTLQDGIGVPWRGDVRSCGVGSHHAPLKDRLSSRGLRPCFVMVSPVLCCCGGDVPSAWLPNTRAFRSLFEVGGRGGGAESTMRTPQYRDPRRRAARRAGGNENDGSGNVWWQQTLAGRSEVHTGARRSCLSDWC